MNTEQSVQRFQIVLDRKYPKNKERYFLYKDMCPAFGNKQPEREEQKELF